MLLTCLAAAAGAGASILKPSWHDCHSSAGQLPRSASPVHSREKAASIMCDAGTAHNLETWESNTCGLKKFSSFSSGCVCIVSQIYFICKINHYSMLFAVGSERNKGSTFSIQHYFVLAGHRSMYIIQHHQCCLGTALGRDVMPYLWLLEIELR